MNKPNKSTQQPSSVPAYPKKTTGSEAAASVRKQANGWSEQKRGEMFDQGMRMIYGGTGPTTAKIRS
jgi:hypothetical protein